MTFIGVYWAVCRCVSPTEHQRPFATNTRTRHVSGTVVRGVWGCWWRRFVCGCNVFIRQLCLKTPIGHSEVVRERAARQTTNPKVHGRGPGVSCDENMWDVSDAQLCASPPPLVPKKRNAKSQFAAVWFDASRACGVVRLWLRASVLPPWSNIDHQMRQPNLSSAKTEMEGLLTRSSNARITSQKRTQTWQRNRNATNTK